jgi:hypothetical protein
MDETVDVTIPVEPEVAAALADARNRDPTWTAGRDFAIENGRNAGG